MSKVCICAVCNPQANQAPGSHPPTVSADYLCSSCLVTPNCRDTSRAKWGSADEDLPTADV